MQAILLHELAHLSDGGYSRWIDSRAAYFQDHDNSYAGFYEDDSRWSYSVHLEKFANEFAYAAGDAFLDDDISGVNLKHDVGSIDPDQLQAMHNQWAPIRDLSTDLSLLRSDLAGEPFIA